MKPTIQFPVPPAPRPFGHGTYLIISDKRARRIRPDKIVIVGEGES